MKRSLLLSTAFVLFGAVFGLLLMQKSSASFSSSSTYLTSADREACPALNPKAFPAPAPRSAAAVKLSATSDTATLYAQLSMLSSSERKTFYASLKGVEKARLWTLHITAFALDRELNEQQRQFVEELLASLKGADLEVQKESLLRQYAGAIERSKSLFGKTESWELMAHLGGASPFESNKQPARFFKTKLMEGDGCSCSASDNWCSGNCGCGQSCSSTTSGCGLFWLSGCDGLCAGGPCPPPIQ